MLPEAGVQITGTEPSTMSEAVAVNVTAAPEGPVASAVNGPGNESEGGVVSTTVTCWIAEAEFPEASVAVHVTGVVPSGN